MRQDLALVRLGNKRALLAPANVAKLRANPELRAAVSICIRRIAHTSYYRRHVPEGNVPFDLANRKRKGQLGRQCPNWPLFVKNSCFSVLSGGQQGNRKGTVVVVGTFDGAHILYPRIRSSLMRSGRAWG